MAFANVKPVGTKLAAGERLAEIETIKAMVELHVARQRHDGGGERGAGYDARRSSTRTLTKRAGWR